MIKMIRSTNAVLVFLAILLGLFSCEKKEIVSQFEDQTKLTISDYVKVNAKEFSSFEKILKAGKLDRILSAYNPNSPGYTLFLPTNEAIDAFIAENDQFNSLDELLADSLYVANFCRYHVIDMGIESNDFTFGALPRLTLSGDILTVSFVTEPDTSYYKINNLAPVAKVNIELSNGYIHILSKALTPIVYTTYEWIQNHPGYSIFKEAADATGLSALLNLNAKDPFNTIPPFTLLIEHDSVFNAQGIHSFDELASMISPGNSDYTNENNSLYEFVGYHIITDVRFLDDFVDVATNYTTYSSVPLYINGAGLDIAINKGKQVYDTLISQGDTSYIDYVGVNYDASNVLSRSGAIHFINKMLVIEAPTQATQTYEFYEEPLLNEFRLEPGTYLVEDSTALYWVDYKGVELFFVKSSDNTGGAWSNDYLLIDGDFDISYTIPKLVQGSYNVLLGADFYNPQNAVVEVFVDGKNIGGLVNTAIGGSASWPFRGQILGKIDIQKFERHTVRVRSLIPGRFAWDYIRFELIKN